MAMIKRVFLFFAVNILVVLTISVLFNILAAYFGIDVNGKMGILLLYSAIGMGGAFFSLFASKFIAKMFYKVQIVDPTVNDPALRQMVQKVHTLAQSAGLRKMPEVGVYQSDEINAFATGPSKNNSLVAVSSGLLHKMNDDEVEGVLAHEVAHIANGDMVTMTIVQGVINTMVLIAARLIAREIGNRLESYGAYLASFIGIQIVLSILGSIVVYAFSRHREFRADAGSAKIAGRQKMIAALRALQRNYDAAVDNMDGQEAIKTLKINGRSRGALAKLFSSHPSLEDRIARLEQMN